KDYLLALPLPNAGRVAEFENEARESHAKQARMEAAQTGSFEDYLGDWFSRIGSARRRARASAIKASSASARAASPPPPPLPCASSSSSTGTTGGGGGAASFCRHEAACTRGAICATLQDENCWLPLMRGAISH